jgi:hypothetical protein
VNSCEERGEGGGTVINVSEIMQRSEKKTCVEGAMMRGDARLDSNV